MYDGGCRWTDNIVLLVDAGGQILSSELDDFYAHAHLVEVQARSLPRRCGTPNTHHRDLLNGFTVKWGEKDIHAWDGGGHMPIERG